MQAHPSQKERIVFLINNTNQCISVLRERRVPPADLNYFQDLLQRQIGVFVEAELAQHFMPLINFVKKTEVSVGTPCTWRVAVLHVPRVPFQADAAALSHGAGGAAGAAVGAGGAAGAGGGGGGAAGLPPGVTPPVDAAVAETLVRDFGRVWRDSMAAINASVLKYFASFANGMEILKQVLTQLLLYYTRFQQIIKTSCPSLESRMVKVAEMFTEIRKYSVAGV